MMEQEVYHVNRIPYLSEEVSGRLCRPGWNLLAANPWNKGRGFQQGAPVGGVVNSKFIIVTTHDEVTHVHRAWVDSRY